MFEGMSAGADDYLVKPLNTDDLELRLIAAARVTSLHRQLAHQRTKLASVAAENRWSGSRSPAITASRVYPPAARDMEANLP